MKRPFQFLLMLAVAGCAGPAEQAGAPDAPTVPTAERVDGSRGARTLNIPEAEPEAAAESPHGTLQWTMPAGWEQVPPATSMRMAQYRVPGSGGDGECYVFYFGPGQGGDPMANAVRWAGQFEQPDGSSSVDAMTTRWLDGSRFKSLVVEVTGIYDGGMNMTAEPSPALQNAMLIGAVVEGPDAPWFFKLTGPEPTVRAAVPAFEGMIRSVR